MKPKGAKTALAVLLWLSIFVGDRALGREVFVDVRAVGASNGTSWADAYNHLRDALIAAKSGDDIRVAQGVYKPDRGSGISSGNRGATFRLIDNITLRGGYAGFGEPVPDARNIARYDTILSGDLGGDDIEVSDPANLLTEPSRRDNCYNVVTATDCNKTTILDGFTITGGNADRIQRQRDAYGGGLHDGNLTVSNCRIVGNFAVQGGGGIACYGAATVRDCTISGNSAGFGGGLYGVDEVANCTVTGNATIQYGGGGIYMLTNTGTVTNCTISGNTAVGDGGGVYVEHCNPMLTRCTLAGNSAGQDGGGVYVDGSTSGGFPKIERCKIVGNSAGRDGGGLHNSGYSFSKLRSCILTGNRSVQNGGGMCDTLGGGSSLLNCTFAYNTAAGSGGGICYDSNPNVGREVANCILWYNSDSAPQIGEQSQVHIKSGPDSVPLTYCSIQGWTGTLGGTGQIGSIGEDPQFVDADGADNAAGTPDDNVRLKLSSPCIDVGDNSVIRMPARDLDGNVRIIHGIVDIGAYESPGGGQRVLPRYEVFDLTTLGGASSWATGINEAGQVVGYSQTADQKQHAFLWDSNVGMIDLGTLGGDTSRAYSINNIGQVVGHASTAAGRVHAFLWHNGRMTDLGVLEGGSHSEAKAINDASQVVGMAEILDRGFTVRRALLWENGVIANLGVLEGRSTSSAVDINLRGQVVGTSSDRAFLWDHTNGMMDLMGVQSWANAINNAGQVVLLSAQKHYIRDNTGGLLDMNLVPFSRTNAINNLGQVVGDFDYLSNDDVHAFLWDNRYDMVDLNTLIPAGSGWIDLYSAGGVNDRGQIVGYGMTADYQEHAFLMTPLSAEDSLVAHWKLDETVGDTAEDSAGDNDGTLKGNPRWRPYSGRVDGALSFDGNGDYVDCGDSTVFDITEAITLATWVKIDAVNVDWQAIISKGDSAWRLSTARNERRFHFAVTGGPPWNYINGDTEVARNEWHHVCGTYDGTNLRLYVDGVEDSASPVPESNGVTTNTYDVYIGANQERPNRFWDGLIDDVRIYSCPLTAVEVHELYMQAPIYVYAGAGGANNGSNWANAYNHVQDGLAAASSGNRIHVAQGTYKPDRGAGVTLGDREASFRLVDGVALKGGYAGFGGPRPGMRNIEKYRTVLSGDLAGNDGAQFSNNGENSYHVVTGSGVDATAVIEGFTITAGNAEEYDGGGMWSISGRATVRHCTFTANLAARGGAMYNEQGTPTLTDCSFVGNKAGRGGAMFNKQASPMISRTSFSDNTAFLEDAANEPRGGGMYNYKGSPTLTDCSFTGNSVNASQGDGGDGGGLFCEQSDPTLINCLIRTNTARRYGGGMANWSGGDAMLVNCVFTGNSAGQQSGGVDNYEVDTTLTNCTFTDNSAPSSGGMHNEGGNLVLANCILWDNSDNAGNSEAAQITSNAGTLLINYSCVQNWTGGLGGTGNIDVDPMFVDADGPDRKPGTEDDDLRLTIDSLCLDVGDNAALPPLVITDLDGNPRIFRETVDMGAYEFQGTLHWYVDGAAGSDNNNGLTPATAFATIQKGVDSAKDGYTVAVYPGVYREEVNFNGMAITVTGQGSDATIIEAPSGYAVSFYTEDANSVLRNVVIRNCGIAGILVLAGAGPTITNVTLVNNEIGILKFNWNEPIISNCIFWNNITADLVNCRASYSCIQRGDAGLGNISANPLFANAAAGDYHLRSERGRYRATTEEWILDDATSPCVDGGDPTVDPFAERMPNGARLNMGAFGGTYYASMSEWPIAADLNRDGIVNMADFLILAESWLSAAEWAL